jgi:HSP20 family molecular chaperone IbpA
MLNTLDLAFKEAFTPSEEERDAIVYDGRQKVNLNSPDLYRLMGWDRMFNRYPHSGIFGSGATRRDDLLVSDDKIIIEATLPEGKITDLSLEIQGNILILSGTRSKPGMDFQKKSGFQRTYILPGRIRPQRILSRLSRGVLKVEIFLQDEE